MMERLLFVYVCKAMALQKVVSLHIVLQKEKKIKMPEHINQSSNIKITSGSTWKILNAIKLL